MSVISDADKAAFLQIKYQYDGMSQGIKLARECEGINERDIQSMIAVKQGLKKKWVDQVASFLRKMPLSSNIISFGDGWYGIRYLDDKLAKGLKIEPIQEADLHHVDRDCQVVSEFTRARLEEILPAVIDEQALNIYKNKLSNDAVDLVYQYCNYRALRPLVDEDEQAERVTGDDYGVPAILRSNSNLYTTISHHAGVRWVQRKIGIPNEAQAVEYKRANLRQVETAILDGFNEAELIWTAEDGIQYYFDPDNIMYVVGGNNIITLYESDFTFAKHINRAIVFDQVDVIHQAWGHLLDAEECHNNLLISVDNELTDIDGKLAVLRAEIELLQAKRNTKVAERDESAKVLGKAKADYHAQCNKLFKKFDM